MSNWELVIASTVQKTILVPTRSLGLLNLLYHVMYLPKFRP